MERIVNWICFKKANWLKIKYFVIMLKNQYSRMSICLKEFQGKKCETLMTPRIKWISSLCWYRNKRLPGQCLCFVLPVVANERVFGKAVQFQGTYGLKKPIFTFPSISIIDNKPPLPYFTIYSYKLAAKCMYVCIFLKEKWVNHYESGVGF